MIVTSFAPAKVNLHLHVGRPTEPGGRHPLDSLLMFAADVGDFVSAGPSGALSLDLTGPFAADLAEDDDNLVLKAARALAEAAGVAPLAALSLHKTLPIASGIGGGSADAAAALRALNLVWNLGAAPEDLEAVAAGLGADVPACVRSRAARMGGFGEVLAPIEAPPLYAVLVNPRAPSPTGAVYRRFDALDLGEALGADAPAPTHDPSALLAWLGYRRNELEAPAREVCPPIGEALTALREAAPGALTRLSGSGATCFALFDAPEAAAAAEISVRAMRPDFWVCATALGSVDVGVGRG